MSGFLSIDLLHSTQLELIQKLLRSRVFCLVDV